MDKLGQKNRSITADVIKAFLIVCVLYGHSVSMLNELRGVSWKDSPLNVFLTSFEMPLFILISGYFLGASLKKQQYKKALNRRILTVAVPLIIWEGSVSFYRFVIYTLENGFAFKPLAKILYSWMFPNKLWFLMAYLICSVIVIMVEWLCSLIRNQRAGQIIGIVSYSAINIVLHFVTFSMANTQFMFAFFVIGFILFKYDLLSNRRINITILIAAVAFFALYPFYRAENAFYGLLTFSITQIGYQLPVFLHRFVLSLCGCALFYVIFKWICKKADGSAVLRAVGALGERTMEVYILSMFIQEPFRDLTGRLFPGTHWITDLTAPLLFGPMFFVVLLAACLLADWILSKIPTVHRLLFGR